MILPLKNLNSETLPDTGAGCYYFENSQHGIELSLTVDTRNQRLMASLVAGDNAFIGQSALIVEPAGDSWSAHTSIEGAVFVACDQFDHDARLYVTGDFGSEITKLMYAQQIADILNQSNKGK